MVRQYGDGKWNAAEINGGGETRGSIFKLLGFIVVSAFGVFLRKNVGWEEGEIKKKFKIEDFSKTERMTKI